MVNYRKSIILFQFRPIGDYGVAVVHKSQLTWDEQKKLVIIQCMDQFKLSLKFIIMRSSVHVPTLYMYMCTFGSYIYITPQKNR